MAAGEGRGGARRGNMGVGGAARAGASGGACVVCAGGAAAHGDRLLDARGTDLHFALPFDKATRLFKQQLGSNLNDSPMRE